ncbi:drug/metabolite transporter (DMT)-like permease [Tumebacillus sp. BK434]|uniref:DMT family transporter n=1 Tax=Tumebacillus sp. BK434 TaxID=2512169 RepID=UPI0010538DE1|nr:DMT family transporter [Tumebacillus sp. BK434]TCP52692.1 drug/metabolite transporter (DMT)-like permease [Tumebacillus sp. BK434]
MGEQKGSPRGIYLLLLLVPLFWGGAFGSGKHVLTEIPPFLTATLRFGLAGLILAVWLTYKKGWDFKLLKERWKGLLLLSLTGILGYNAFFFLGLQFTSAANGSLVVAMNPVSTTLAAVIFLGEAWSRRLGVGMALSLIGLLVVITGGSWETIRTMSFNSGDIMLLGAVASWSIYSAAGKVIMKGMSSLFVTTVTMIVGTVGLFIGSLFEGGWGQVSGLSLQSVAELVYMAVFASVIAFVIWNIGIQRIGASKTSAYVNLVPICATTIAVLLYGEQVTWAHAAGVVLTVSGVLITTSSPAQRKHASVRENV